MVLFHVALVFVLQNELLASQHNDDNSVACIEEKCYVLGTSQYCRYMHPIIWMGPLIV